MMFGGSMKRFSAHAGGVLHKHNRNSIKMAKAFDKKPWIKEKNRMDTSYQSENIEIRRRSQQKSSLDIEQQISTE